MHKIVLYLHRDYGALRVRQRFICLTMALATLLVLCPHPVMAVGLDPVPVFDSADVVADVQREPTSNPFVDQFVYTYTIGNPSTNTGEIWYIKIDISEPVRHSDFPDDATLELGATTIDFGLYRQDLLPLALPAGADVIPIGQTVPPGWLGGFGRDGFLGFASGDAALNIQPGQIQGGFRMVSRRVPTLREIRVIPNWVHLVLDHETVTEEERDQAADVELDLLFTTFTLGPSSVIDQGSFEHWNRLRDDLERLINELQCVDPGLGTTLVALLTDARAALDARDGTLAKVRLQLLLDALAQAPAGQICTEGRQLVQLNADSLIEQTRDTPIPFEPEVTVTPQEEALPVGARYTLLAKILNTADNDAPVPGFRLNFRVLDGSPHEDEEASADTDVNGEATFSFVGERLGVDNIQVEDESGELIFAKARVRWEGGPDLVVPFFMPPEIVIEGTTTLFITDVTANVGTVVSPPSVTRYFISDTQPVDPATAMALGERQVEALEPEQLSNGINLEFTTGSLPPGIYFLAACADANESIAELDEDNNCSFNELETMASIVVRGEVAEITNNAPDCSQAAASPDFLWPPNHKLVDISIAGITDLEGDPISLTITGIQQDEPINGVADGNTSPDGFGVGASQAQVRRERSGQGNGRIYEIGFDAQDDQGGSCTGSVLVGVPHDQGQGSTVIDDGVRFDSTQP